MKIKHRCCQLCREARRIWKRSRWAFAVAGEHAIDPIKSLDVQVAAKTGTAEVEDFTNASLVGYAPYDKEAKVAFACSVPESATNDQSVAGNLCAYNIMPEVLKEFFKKY